MSRSRAVARQARHLPTAAMDFSGAAVAALGRAKKPAAHGRSRLGTGTLPLALHRGRQTVETGGRGRDLEPARRAQHCVASPSAHRVETGSGCFAAPRLRSAIAGGGLDSGSGTPWQQGPGRRCAHRAAVAPPWPFLVARTQSPRHVLVATTESAAGPQWDWQRWHFSRDLLWGLPRGHWPQQPVPRQRGHPIWAAPCATGARALPARGSPARLAPCRTAG